MPTLHLNGVDLHYREAGPADAPLVLLLHGSFSSSADWAPYLPVLAGAGYRAVALDDRGHGGSTRFGEPGNPWDALSIPTFADDARALLASLGRPAHIVGHSRGATVGAFVAYEEGAARVPSLVSVATPPQATEAFRAFFRRQLERPSAGAGYASELAARTRAYLAGIPEDHFPAELLTQYKGRGLVVEAGDDPLYSPVGTSFWRAWLRDAEVERVENGGHAFLFDGGDGEAAFKARLLAWLAEVAR